MMKPCETSQTNIISNPDRTWLWNQTTADCKRRWSNDCLARWFKCWDKSYNKWRETIMLQIFPWAKPLRSIIFTLKKIPRYVMWFITDVTDPIPTEIHQPHSFTAPDGGWRWGNICDLTLHFRRIWKESLTSAPINTVVLWRPLIPDQH